MSNYNYGLEPGVRSSGSSRGRFVLIFLAVSALTAALVWWFWPGEVKTSEKESGKQTEETVSSEVNEEIKDGSAAEKASQGTGAAAVTPVDEGKKNGSGPQSDKKSENTPPAVDPTDPPLPQKGVLTPADQKGADLPAVAAEGSLSADQEEALRQALLQLKAGDHAAAAKSAEKALEGVTEYSPFYRKAWRILTDARWGMILKKSKCGFVLRDRIRSGDTLGGIASKHLTTVELLRKINNISGSRIFVGKPICIVPGDWKIIVSKKYRLLKLFNVTKEGEKLFALFDVGVGRMGKTPVAEFAIASRVRHPDWYLPDGRVYKYGDKENQLGDYFLKLAPAAFPGRPLRGYGIHGAQDESTVGRSLSNGCIRMLNRDVEMLYFLVPVGCRVNIVEE